MRRLLFNLQSLRDLLARKLVFESAQYREAELTRLLNLFAHVDLDRWRGLRLLEVGSGLGRIGDVFEKLGFDVTSTDGRPEYVERMRTRGRKAFHLDLDTMDVSEAGEFDLILAFGVLYHLSQPERFLQGCARTAKVLVLETCVCDSHEPVLQKVREPTGWRGQDQALLGLGCRPSPAWVEKTCRAAGFSLVQDISSPVGNWETGSFDWPSEGTGQWRKDGVNLRKMWVCEQTGWWPKSPWEAS